MKEPHPIMERTVVLIRHAKAEDGSQQQNDFDRSLTESGKKDAVFMAAVLKAAGLKPDLVLASPAKRTRQTAKRIAEGVGYDPDAIIWVEKFYHCSPEIMAHELMLLDDHIGTVFIVAHNPGITALANELDPAFSVSNMATCGCVAARFTSKHWDNFPTAVKKVYFQKQP